MAAKVIHFGPDDCHRLMVLRSAGYSIDDCRSLIQLRECLGGNATAEALLMSDTADAAPWEAIALAKAHASLPVVLFRTTNLTYTESGVDLVVHCLTPPEEWLCEVDSLIEKSRLVRNGSQVLAGNSARPARGPTLAVPTPSTERDRAWEEKTRPPASERPPGAERIRPRERIR